MTHRGFGVEETILYDTVNDGYVILLSKPIECTRMNSKVNNGLWVNV